MKSSGNIPSTSKLLWFSHEKAAVIIALIICIALNPHAHAFGRFWAEEGSYFFQYIQDRSLFESLTYVYKGTIQITTNIAVYLADKVGLSYAPLVTSWIGTGFIALFAFLFGIWAKSLALGRIFFCIALAIILISGQFYEVHANSTNLQWTCSACMLVIAFLPKELIARHSVLLGIGTLLAGLSGVPSNTIAPLFFIKAFLEKSIHRAMLGVILAATTAMQLFVIISSNLQERDLSRYSVFELVYMSLVKPVSAIILTQKGSQTIMSLLYGNLPSIALFGIAIAMAAAYLYWVFKSSLELQIKQDLALLLLTGSYVSVINVAGSLSSEMNAMTGIGGGRYFLIGFVTVLMSMCIIANKSRPPVTFLIKAVLLGGLALNIGYALATNMTNRYAIPTSWHGQIERCERVAQPLCDVTIWPANLDRKWDVQVDLRSEKEPDGGDEAP